MGCCARRWPSMAPPPGKQVRGMGAAAVDEATLRRLLDSALLSGVFAERPVPAPAAQTAIMLDALATLPPRARAVVVLRYWAGLSVEEVADFLGCPADSVASDNAHALHELSA